MPLIAEHVLDEVQSRADIAEVIGRYIPLHRVGRHFKALCPFHKERTPSFHVNTDKQIFHCFGCGVGGNVFSFLMQQDRLTFPEAVQRLAQELGVAMPDAPRRDAQIDELFEILEKACKYYERVLAHPEQGRRARDYLQQRGVDDRSRRAFRLGYASDGWDHLVRASRRANSSAELLQRAGLTSQGARGPIDRFRNRLMFPIRDARGRVVGFGGRGLDGEEPKYLNSPETPIYSKGRQLFGLDLAKEAIIQVKCVILVEGYFDCVLLWQAGIEHVVSPSGTALTPEQARSLSRYTERAVLAFDPDAAGEAASVRGIETLLEAGLQVQVAQLPQGMDPDECVRAQGVDAFRQLLAKAAHVMEFLLAGATKQFDLRQAEERVRAAQRILSTISKVPNAMLRAEYVRVLAESLRLDERAVGAELRRSQGRAKPLASSGRMPAESASGAERLLTALVLDDPNRWDVLQEQQLDSQLQDATLQRLVSTIGAARSAEGQLTPAQLISRLQSDGLGPLVAELVELAQSVVAKDSAFQECMQRIHSDVKKRQLAVIQEQIRQAQRSGASGELARLLEACQRLVKGIPEPSVGDATADTGVPHQTSR